MDGHITIREKSVLHCFVNAIGPLKLNVVFPGRLVSHPLLQKPGSAPTHKSSGFLRHSQVHRESGKVEIGDSVFDSLPYLVAELRKSWMKDLQPITHS